MANTTFKFSWVRILRKIKEQREDADRKKEGGGKEIKEGDYRSAAGALSDG